MAGANIIGAGSYTPKTDRTPQDMSKKALRQALRQANINKKELEGIIITTTHYEKQFPKLARELQKSLRLQGGIYMDIGANYAGFPFGITTANNYLRQQEKGIIAVIGTENFATETEERPYTTTKATGAGALLLQANNDKEKGIQATYNNILTSKARLQGLKKQQGTLQEEEGKQLYQEGIEELAKALQELTTTAGWKKEEVNKYFFRQTNTETLEQLNKAIGIRTEQYYKSIEGEEHTSVASIPIQYTKALQEGILQEGNKIIMASMGTGMQISGVAVQL